MTMASLGQRQDNSAMDCSPRNTANLLPSSSRMELHPPAGDADPWLHRNYLSPRPHRPVLIGSTETELKAPAGAGQAQLLQHRCTPTPHVFPSLFTGIKLPAAELGSGGWQKLRKRCAPRPRGKGFTRQMIELEVPSTRQLWFRTDEVHKNSSCV